nr:hypothetical protein [Tanacetum cinerariifolium]
MTTLAEHIIVAGAENRPLMLEKSMYDAWASRIRLFIKGKKNGKMMLDSIDNGPLVYSTIEEMGKLKLRNTLNSLKHNNFKMIVMFKQQYHSSRSSTRCVCTCKPSRGIAKTSRGNYAASQAKVMKCYNYLGEGHMEKQCTLPKRLKNFAWFKEKLMLAEAQEASQILDEEQLAFIADTGIAKVQDTNSSTPNDLLVLSLVEQMTDHVANLDKENQTYKMVNESLTVDLERYKEYVAIFEQRQNVDLNKREKLIDSLIDDLIRNRNAKFTALQ